MERLLRELFEQHYKELYSYLYSLSRDAALSEDLASEVFLEAVKSIGSFRGQSDGKTWLFSIARHRWFAYLRQKKRKPQTESLEEFPLGAGASPESDYLKKETAQRIKSLLAGEPERTRTILRLRMEGYSFHEIGNKLGISENSARVIDFRAKAKIRQALQKEGFCDV